MSRPDPRPWVLAILLVAAGLIAGAPSASRRVVEAPAPAARDPAIAAETLPTIDLPDRPGAEQETALRADLLQRAAVLDDAVAATLTEPHTALRADLLRRAAVLDDAVAASLPEPQTAPVMAMSGQARAMPPARPAAMPARPAVWLVAHAPAPRPGPELVPAVFLAQGVAQGEGAPVAPAATSLFDTVAAAMPAGLDVSAVVGADLRVFPHDPAFPAQQDDHFLPSVFAQFELVYEWNEGADRLTFLPFGRWAPLEDSRTHADIREANWLHVERRWDVLVGISRVFWGVTESRHLVDIVNQIDVVEDLKGEQKLGQPMVNLNLLTDLGTLGLFVLPGFRERPFPDQDERLGGPLPINDDDAEFDSDLEQASVSFAARYTNSFGPIDLGLAHFYGTSREPRFMVRTVGEAMEIVPRYDEIHQTSVDAQATLGNWLWKLEALTRSGQGDRFYAAVGGFEYTVFDLFGTDASLGLLAEYLYDDREDTFTPFLSSSTAFDDDIFVGTRLMLNDVAGTRLLAGAVVDREHGSTALTLEAERRLGDDWLLELKGRGFVNVDSMDPLAAVQDDDFIQVGLKRFF